MGWFPGYAIDIETGERLNIIFAEDSWQKDPELNGNDMLWNPTSKIATDNFNVEFNSSTNTVEWTGGDYLLGGKHFIYVVKGEAWVKGSKEYLADPLSKDKYSPNYDEGRWIYNQLSDPSNPSGRWNVFKNISWVGVPLLAPGKSLLTSDVKVKLRVSKPFKQYETTHYDNFYSSDDSLLLGRKYTVSYMNTAQTWGGKKVTFDKYLEFSNDSVLVDVFGVDANGNLVLIAQQWQYVPLGTAVDTLLTYIPGETFVAPYYSFSGSNKARVIEANSVNSFNPVYRFSTDDIVATTGNINVAKDAMDDIRAVPNPYYGKSTYETNQLDNRVKLTNLPQQATISIFSVNGTLVRKLKKDDSMTFIDWDLKNDFGIPIASGLYVIHVRGKFYDNGQIVEKDKIIKWFGALRPIDLDTF